MPHGGGGGCSRHAAGRLVRELAYNVISGGEEKRGNLRGRSLATTITNYRLGFVADTVTAARLAATAFTGVTASQDSFCVWGRS